MTATEKHYVEFLSPGTFFSEQSRKPIHYWDTYLACIMAREITERYNAKPYGFRFYTMLGHEPIPDGRGGELTVTPKEIGKSGLYWIGGEIRLYDDIPDTAENEILLGNMRCNDEPIIVENKNSYRFTGWFGKDDAIVNANGDVIRSGSDEDLEVYRRTTLQNFAAWRAELAKKYAQEAAGGTEARTRHQRTGGGKDRSTGDEARQLYNQEPRHD